MKPIRIQLSRAKGWRMPENTLSVARTTHWGNPWRVGVDGPADKCVALYRLWLSGHIRHPMTGAGAWSPETLRIELGGKNLACWCPVGSPDHPCHADVLLEIANKEQE